MKYLALLALLASSLTQCLNPSGDTYFVDVNHPEASDSNPGSQTQPWRSIVHAVASTQPGDRIWIMSGCESPKNAGRWRSSWTSSCPRWTDGRS